MGTEVGEGERDGGARMGDTDLMCQGLCTCIMSHHQDLCPRSKESGLWALSSGDCGSGAFLRVFLFQPGQDAVPAVPSSSTCSPTSGSTPCSCLPEEEEFCAASSGMTTSHISAPEAKVHFVHVLLCDNPRGPGPGHEALLSHEAPEENGAQVT